MTHQMTEKFDALREENEELKQELAKLKDIFDELKHENNFNKAKATELKELFEIKGTEATTEKLMKKSLENAEMSLKVDKLNMELHQANMCVHNLGKERDGHKRMLLELSDIVRTLQSVDIEYKATEQNETYLSGQDIPLKNVKAKVEAIMEDRNYLVLRCKLLEEENREKEAKIVALESQFHLLNTINMQDSMDEGSTSHFSFKDHSSRTSRTASSSSSFDNESKGLTRTPSLDGSIESQGREEKPWRTGLDKPWRKSLRKAWGDDTSLASGGTAAASDGDESRYEIKKTRSDVSCVSGNTNPASESSSVSSVHVNKITTFDESEETETLRKQLEDAHRKYSQFKEVCQGAFSKMGEIEQDLVQAKDDADSSARKRDEYKENLRDVINQYKQLHDEYDEAIAKIESLKDQICSLENQHTEYRKRAAEVLMEDGLANNVDELISAYLRAGEKIVTLERKLAAAEREAEASAKIKELKGRKLRDAIATHRKLEQEKSYMAAIVAAAEDQVRVAKREARRHREEARHTRRRLTTFIRKVDKLESEQQMDSDHIPEFKETKQLAIDTLPLSAETLHRMIAVEAMVVGKAWQEKRELLSDQRRLANENEELKAFCEEVLTGIGAAPLEVQ